MTFTDHQLYSVDSLPKDGSEFWIVTDECEAHNVSYYAEAYDYERRDVWCETDINNHGSMSHWEASEILGWTLSFEIAEDAAKAFAEFEG
jgi:hypothetical protein